MYAFYIEKIFVCAGFFLVFEQPHTHQSAFCCKEKIDLYKIPDLPTSIEFGEPKITFDVNYVTNCFRS